MIVYPERLCHRVTMLTRGRLSCWQPTGMSYLFYYTEQLPPPHPRAPKIHEKLKLTKLTWAVLFRSSRFTVLTMFGYTTCICFILPEQPTISTGLRFYFFPWIETLAHVVLNNKIVPLLTAAFCWGLEIPSPRAGILKAWRPQQHRASWNGTLTTGANTSSPWQRVIIRRMVIAVKEPTETQVANSFDKWLSSNGMRVFSREV